MINRIPASCLIFTLNEERNLPACLETLKWCDDVVVVDSYSTDQTEQIARNFGARYIRHEFTGFGDQRNWALREIILKYEWALILDADERVPCNMVEELQLRLPRVGTEVGAFRIRRRFHLWGRWLKYSSLYPTWVVRLVRVGNVTFVNRGHAETEEVVGRLLTLESDLIDENLNGIDEWWERQRRYAKQDAKWELEAVETPSINIFNSNPLQIRATLKYYSRYVPARPLTYFLYAYFFRHGFLDGVPGLKFCLMKSGYQALLTRELRRLKKCKTPRANEAKL